MVPFGIKRSFSVLTISDFSAGEISECFGVSPEKIEVAHLGIGNIFRQERPESRPQRPYFLLVGNLQPRKNVLTAVEAYRRLVRALPSLEERLLIVGQWDGQPGLDALLAQDDLASRVELPGYVEDGALVDYFRDATGFLFPSVYEGFGFPPLEAMALGTPVIVADIPVMREIAGPAIRVPPLVPDAWAAAMQGLVSSKRDNEALVEAGRKHSRKFTWVRTAETVVASLEAAAYGS